jgi:hypothetical protein
METLGIIEMLEWYVLGFSVTLGSLHLISKLNILKGERKETGVCRPHHTKSVNKDQESLLSKYIDVIWMHRNDY